MKIYFAGSIAGGRDDSEIYVQIINYIKKYGNVLTEHIGDTKMSHEGEKDKTPKLIFTRDVSWVKESDIIIAEVTIPSIGVGYELGLAESLGKKIICLHRTSSGKRLTPMVEGNDYNKIIRYNNLEELFEKLDNYFKK